MAIHATERYFRRQPAKRLLVGVVVVVSGLTWWGWRSEPPSRLVGSQRVAGGTTISLPQDRHPGPHRAWSAELRLAGGAQPGVRWSLHEGKNPGEGYELHWLPDLPGLALWRAPRAFLLGSVRLARPPGRITWTRVGARLTVEIDGRTALVCIDPVGVPESGDPTAEPLVRAWSCRTDNTLGDALLTVQLIDAGRDWGADIPVRAGLNPDLDKALHDPTRHDLPLLSVRQALAQIEAGRDPVAAGAALGHARITVDPGSVLGRLTPFRADPGEDHLRLWLGLGRVQLALSSRRLAAGSASSGEAAGEDAAEVVATELGEMGAVARSSGRPPEQPGILMSLLPGLARQAAWRPDYPRDPREVLAGRAVWSRLLGEAAVMALRHGGADLPPALAIQLRLLTHAAGCQLARLGEQGHLPADSDGFTGGPLPTPVEGPPWLTARWRALAGADPGVDLIPPLPGLPGAPLGEALARLEGSAGLAPVGAVRMRNQVIAAVDELRRERGGGQEGRAQDLLREALEAAPAREAGLAKALIAWHLGSSLGDERRLQAMFQPARRELVSAVDGSTPEETDPVAFALVALLEARCGGMVGESDRLRRTDQQDGGRPGSGREQRWTVFEGGGIMSGLVLPRTLAAYARLLDGQPRALDYVWLGDLHPTQALVAALAMQEVARIYEKNPARRQERRGRGPGGDDAGASRAAEGAGERRSTGPDWSLLRRMPCLTLPAELLIPADAPDRGAGETGESGPLPP